MDAGICNGREKSFACACLHWMHDHPTQPTFMDLKSGYPFWAVKNGLLHAFPPLQGDLRCEVAVLGAGITGALIADELVAHGHDVAVLEQRDVAWGSTAASTALLQYEIDTHMVDLAKRHGEADALLAYRACAEAIDLLRDKAREVRDVDFLPQQSLYFASRGRHVRALREEYDMRLRHGFDVQWLDRSQVQQRFGFDAPVAILSRLAASVDPYRFAYRLLQRARERGAAVHDRTRVTRIQARPRSVVLTTAEGCTVRARYLVLATGYAAQEQLGRHVARNRSSYAFITDPLPKTQLGPLATTMLWESARPYLYLRTTGEGRLLVGGEDDAVDIAARRDARVDGKARKLAKRVGSLFPGLTVEPVFSWAGTFAETPDGLPFFGPHRDHGRHVMFAMAYGGNGITYSMLGAGLLRALIEGRSHPLRRLFSFERPT